MLEGDIPANKQANKQIILGKTLQGVEGYYSLRFPRCTEYIEALWM
jgi:CHASE2 domain-containing sensor protein